MTKITVTAECQAKRQQIINILDAYDAANQAYENVANVTPEDNEKQDVTIFIAWYKAEIAFLQACGFDSSLFDIEPDPEDRFTISNCSGMARGLFHQRNFLVMRFRPEFASYATA